ncbi:mucolipin-3-like [Dysidea avara]|uniref:mucolipin-3-like n=1 Tax=Dysidea avara TaxID=196820 RepID=UPI00331D0A3B
MSGFEKNTRNYSVLSDNRDDTPPSCLASCLASCLVRVTTIFVTCKEFVEHYFIRACLNHFLGESSAKDMKQTLRDHFRNQFQKWNNEERPLFPWKATLHILLVALVTAQGSVYVSETRPLTRFLKESINVYSFYFTPVSRIYTLSGVYDQITHVVMSYYNVTDELLISYNYTQSDITAMHPLNLTMEIFLVGAENDTNIDDSAEERYWQLINILYSATIDDVCECYDDNDVIWVECFTYAEDCDCSVKEQVACFINDETIHRIKLIAFHFTLSSLFPKHVLEEYSSIHADIDFDITMENDLYIGMDVDTGLDIKLRRIDSKQFMAKVTILDIFILLAILASTALIVMSYFSTFKLAKKVKRHFAEEHEKNIQWQDLHPLFSKWYIFAILTNLLILVATILKISSEYMEDIVVGLIETVRILLGIGLMLLWCGMFGFLKYFDTLNVLFITLGLAIPSVIRFAVCMFILFTAFTLCGWLVLSPYHPKFQTLWQSVEALFCTLNGDDLYVTFTEGDSTYLSAITEIFSKLYLALFVFIFIYAVLSLFIGIFTHAYDSLSSEGKECSHGFLHDWAEGKHREHPTKKYFSRDRASYAHGNYETDAAESVKAEMNIVNTTSIHDGRTPLHFAAQNGHAQVVGMLIRSKVNVNVTAKDGRKPLHFAAEYGHTQVVEILIKSEADVNAADKNDETPLHYATENGHAEVVEMLLKSKADVSAVKKNGWTALHVAAHNGYSQVVETLLHFKTDKNTTPLQVVQNSHDQVIQMGTIVGVDVNVITRDGWTPLHFAAQNGNAHVVGMLIKSEANVNATTKDKQTPLHRAALCGHVEVVEVLMNFAANINSINEDGCTPLLVASQNGHAEIVEMLMMSEANANASNKGSNMEAELKSFI